MTFPLTRILIFNVIRRAVHAARYISVFPKEYVTLTDNAAQQHNRAHHILRAHLLTAQSRHRKRRHSACCIFIMKRLIRNLCPNNTTIVKLAAIISIALMASASSGIGRAQSNSSPPASNSKLAQTPTPASPEDRKVDLESARLKLERDKFDEEKIRENKKLELENKKAWLTTGSIVVPLLAALITLWSFRRQLTENTNAQQQTAKLQFEIKAAEIAFSGKTPEAVGNRAAVLKKMFGDRLPKDFPPSFDPTEHGGGIETSEEKLVFLRLILEHPDKKKEIVELWNTLFGDRWLERVEPLIVKQESAATLKDQDIATQDPVADKI